MMTKSMRLNVPVLLIDIFSLVGMPAMSADIYKSVDKNGVVTFSDTPPKEKSTSDERIELPAHTNRMPSIEVPERQLNDIQPPLKEEEFVALYLDGTRVAPPPENTPVDTHLRNARDTQARGATRVLIGTSFGFISTHNRIRFTTFSTLRSA
jgi:hypothetical protein